MSTGWSYRASPKDSLKLPCLVPFRFHKVTNPKVLDEMECQTKTLFAGKATKSKPPSGSRLPSPPPSAPAEETDGEVVVVNEEGGCFLRLARVRVGQWELMLGRTF